MHIDAVKTRVLQPPKDDLLAVLEAHLPRLDSKSVVVVSSKIVAIWQGRCEHIPHGADVRQLKSDIAMREADSYLDRDERYPYARHFTMFEGVLGSVAGIDESNSDGWLTLLPKHADAVAEELRSHIRTIRDVADLGVIISDSRGRPMRNGVTGLALGHAGFEAMYDYRGQKDLFGRPLKYERLNVADGLAAAASVVMGEGAESTPLAVITDIPHISFTTNYSDDALLTKTVTLENDVFARFFKDLPWKKGGTFSSAESEPDEPQSI